MQRFVTVSATLAFLSIGQASAQTVTYSNVTTYNGIGFWSSSTQNSGANIISAFAADDIFYASPSISRIREMHFSVFNFNDENVTARPILRFFDDNGANGGPGTYLGGFDLSALTFTGGGVTTLFSLDISDEPPLVTDGTFWAGLAFDNNFGATGATAVQLENLGQGLFSPPTIGSSTDHFFVSNELGNFTGNNPNGDFLDFFGLIPADFGWQFTIFNPVPEPSSLLLVGGVGVVGILVMRRRPQPRRRSLQPR